MKNLPYVRFLNLVRELNKSSPALDRCVPLLAYAADVQQQGKPVRCTDLVQKLDFGTAPTVYKKISLLSELGYIKSLPDEDDGRVKLLHVTTEGFAILEQFDLLLKKALLT